MPGAQLHIANGAAVDFSHISYTFLPHGASDGYSDLRNINGIIYLKGVSIQVTVLGKQLSYEVKKLRVTTTTDAEGNNITQVHLTGAAAVLNGLLKPARQNKYLPKAK